MSRVTIERIHVFYLRTAKSTSAGPNSTKVPTGPTYFQRYGQWGRYTVSVYLNLMIRVKVKIRSQRFLYSKVTFSIAPSIRAFRACPVHTFGFGAPTQSADCGGMTAFDERVNQHAGNTSPRNLVVQLCVQKKAPYQPVSNLWRPPPFNKQALLSAIPCRGEWGTFAHGAHSRMRHIRFLRFAGIRVVVRPQCK